MSDTFVCCENLKVTYVRKLEKNYLYVIIIENYSRDNNKSYFK